MWRKYYEEWISLSAQKKNQVAQEGEEDVNCGVEESGRIQILMGSVVEDDKEYLSWRNFRLDGIAQKIP